MNILNAKESGLYIVVGPLDYISLLPTENVLFLYPNGDWVMDGSDPRENDVDFAKLEVVSVALASEWPSLVEGDWNG